MSDTLQSVARALSGRYRVERLLGEGGMATVYLAHDERYDRKVAIKVLKPDLARSIGLGRFEREISFAARLNHPHILPLLDSGTLNPVAGEAPSAFYVMPYVDGESLRAMLTRSGKLPVQDAVRISREVADALDYAHRRGVVHRDIKPENVLLSDGHAVVTDFGIARALNEASGNTLTTPGTSVGTPAYMSPEQITGDHEVDGRTDQYALGCMLFEMLTGNPPWTGTMQAVLARRLAESAPRVRTVEVTVPEIVDLALARALAREPEDRFDSPARFAGALAGLESSGPVPQLKRPMLLRIAAGVVALAAVFYVGMRLTRPARAEAVTSLAIAPDSADPEIAYLSQGIQESVADLLRRLPQLRVSAPSLVSQMRRQEPGINSLDLGEKLKVGAVLTWRLQKTHDSVQVTAELMSIPGGALMKDVRYTRPFDDVPAMQGDLARMIAEGMRLTLTGAEEAVITRRPTASAKAYDLYQRGRRASLRGLPLGATDAKVLMDSSAYYGREAIKIDPDFAQAQALLSLYYFVSAFRNWAPFDEYIDSAIVSSNRALAVDSTLGEAWLNFTSKAIYLDDDWPTAVQNVTRSLRLSSHDSQTLQFAAIVTAEVQGKLDSALSLARKARDAEPSGPILNTLGDIFMRTGQYDSAAAVLRKALEFDPRPPGPRRRLINSLEQLKRYDEAIAVRREGGDTAGAALYAAALKSDGEAGYKRALTADLQRQVAAQVEAAGKPFTIPADTVPQLREERIIALYAQLGDWTKATDWVLKLMERRPRRLLLVVNNPAYRGLFSDPRFAALARKEKPAP